MYFDLFSRRWVFAPDGVPSGGQAPQGETQEPTASPALVTPSAPKTDAPKTFDEAYVNELRGESKSYRLQLRETQEALKELQSKSVDSDAKDQKAAELEAKLSEALAKADAAEKLATAIRYGAKAGIDADVIAMLDLSKIDLSSEQKAHEALSKLGGGRTGGQARPGPNGTPSDADLRALMFGQRRSTIFGG